MNVSIRKFHEGDYLAIGSLIENELGYSIIDYSSLTERLRKIESDDNYMTYVAVIDNNIIGFIGLLRYINYERDYESLRILAMAVSKEHQKKGVGSKLLRQAEHFALENNIAHIMLTSNMKRNGAHRFYEHNDYVKKSFGFFKTLNK